MNPAERRPAPTPLALSTGTHREGGVELPLVWWVPPRPLRAVSSALVGGGIGPMAWYLNATVPADYGRRDPAGHVRDLARAVGLHGAGVGMLTAVDVTTVEQAEDGGVVVFATVGLGWPTWAAAPDRPTPDAPAGTATGPPPPGTINLLVVVPEPVDDAALVNLLATVTEAKVQALVEAGVAGTGTASDAVCVACPAPPAGWNANNTDENSHERDDGRARFGGPRSFWGARTARAVHTAVSRGTAADTERAIAGGWPRPPRQAGWDRPST